MLIEWLWRLTSSAAVLVWMGLIFYWSSLTQVEVSGPLDSPAISWLGVLRSYLAHAVIYGVLASLAQASLWRWSPDYRLRWVLAAAAFATIYGISDEYHQSLVLGRSSSISDAIVNSLGATTAAAILWLVAAWWRGRLRPSSS